MWRRGKTVGRGAFGFVSLATFPVQQHDHAEDDDGRSSSFNQPRVMAVKSSPVSQSRSLSKERRLLKEFEACPYILRTLGADVTHENGEDLYNLFLEYAGCGSLADHVRRGGAGLPELEVKKHTKSILMGLNYIHKRGYVHCDIKPDNILLLAKACLLRSLSSSSTSRVNGNKKRFDQEISTKIADFGLAKKAGKEVKLKQGKPRGTPMYMAPESILRKEYEPNVDIWALGCTVLQMLTGERPWKCDRDTEVWNLLYRIGFTEEIPEIPNGVPGEARDFLKKCLVRDPSSRWNAEMLLEHPFVSSTIADDEGAITSGIKEKREIPSTKEAVGIHDSSSSKCNLPKPNLPHMMIVNDTQSGRSSISEEELLVKPYFALSDNKKRKRMEKIAQDQRQPRINLGVNCCLGLIQCDVKKRNLMMPDLKHRHSNLQLIKALN